MNMGRQACAGLFVLLLACSASGQAEVRHVLLLQSLDRGNLTMDGFTADFRIHVERRSSTPVTFMQAVVNPSGFSASPEKPIVDYLASAFADQPKPDLVVTIGGPAAVFARKYGQQLFPDSRLLLTAVSTRFVAGAPLSDHETAVASDNDMAAIVDDILRLFPQTTTVFMVMGSGPLGKFWRAEMERDFARFRGRITFVWSDEMSFAEILSRLAAAAVGGVLPDVRDGWERRRVRRGSCAGGDPRRGERTAVRRAQPRDWTRHRRRLGDECRTAGRHRGGRRDPPPRR
jgi:hypothetical protein